MHTMISCFARAVVAVAVISASLGAQEPRLSGTPAPLDAVTTIVDAFRTHRVVALSEGHGEERGHAFRMSLIRDVRFPGAANDILVEFGNSLYQDVIDRFIGGPKTTASWDGATLVLSSTFWVDGKMTGSGRELYRIENGLLIVESTRETPAGRFTGRHVHQKKL